MDGWRKAVVIVVLLSLAGCAALEVRIERTPTPDLDAVGTLAALMVQGTRYALEIEAISLDTTPVPPQGYVQGAICYPADRVPQMAIYLRELSSNRVTAVSTVEGQQEYTVELPPGDYLAFAWVDRYKVGGMYTYAVACGMEESCSDHRPLPFTVQEGESVVDINICDWVYGAGDLPFPENSTPSGAEPTGQAGGS